MFHLAHHLDTHAWIGGALNSSWLAWQNHSKVYNIVFKCFLETTSRIVIALGKLKCSVDITAAGVARVELRVGAFLNMHKLAEECRKR